MCFWMIWGVQLCWQIWYLCLLQSQEDLHVSTATNHPWALNWSKQRLRHPTPFSQQKQRISTITEHKPGTPPMKQSGHMHRTQLTIVDPCLYYRWIEDKYWLMALVVDDMILAKNNTIWLFEEELGRRFEVKATGDLAWCLGCESWGLTPKYTFFCLQDAYSMNIYLWLCEVSRRKKTGIYATRRKQETKQGSVHCGQIREGHGFPSCKHHGSSVVSIWLDRYDRTSRVKWLLSRDI